MSIVSLRLSEQLLEETKKVLTILHLSQTVYIRQALEQMNKTILAQEREKKFRELSLKARTESMRINHEFEQIESDIYD